MIQNYIRSLKRDTKSTRFIPEIDGMRFFAIITVVLFHLNTAFSRSIDLSLSEVYNILNENSFAGQGLGFWIRRFSIGVRVFFVISGFILAVPFVKYYFGEGRKIDLKIYFFRRLTRLEPPYIVSMIIFFVIHIFILNGNFNELIKNFIVGLFYLHELVYGTFNPINPVTWSLETEAQFYILIPFLLMFLFFFRNKKWIYSMFFILFLVTILSTKYFLTAGNNHLNQTILVYLVNFLVGVFIAVLYVKYKIFFTRKSFFWDLINVISVFIMFYYYNPRSFILNIIMLNIGMFFFFISVFKSKLFNWFYTQPIIYTIGGMCYSIYLLHYAFFHLSIKLTSKILIFDNYLGNFIIQILINIPLVLIVSTIFFVFVEKPFMNRDWLERLKLKWKAIKSN